MVFSMPKNAAEIEDNRIRFLLVEFKYMLHICEAFFILSYPSLNGTMVVYPFPFKNNPFQSQPVAHKFPPQATASFYRPFKFRK
jgi:hypothetical protein